MIPKIFDYLRISDRFPHILCPGCGTGIVMGTMVRAFEKLGLDKNKLCVVSGIGCSSRIPGYIDADTFHTLHGRAIPSATGVKLARPEMTVVALGGDGDMLAIGGNHFIHAARRNLDLTVIVLNNFNYGMTGGQFSPTTPLGARATTAPYGNLERGFDVCDLARASGAVFVARSTVYHVTQLERFIRLAIQKKGLAVVEAVSNCHTLFGRLNKMGDIIKMIEWIRDSAVPVEQAGKKTPEELKGKFLTGVLWDTEAPEYNELYQKLLERVHHAL
jgi:2-oxoglutarate ferredoxin oxidoreductase subunit beta